MYKVLFNNISFWISATVVAVAMLYWIFLETASIRLDEAALDQDTQVVFGFFDGDRVHCFDMTEALDCLEPAGARALPESVLWLGNSQLHAINQPSPDSVPASVTATKILREFDIELITFSQPNANLKEHYVLFLALSDIFDFKLLVLPVVFDDMRERGLRPKIKQLLSSSNVINELSNTDIGADLIKANSDILKNKKPNLQTRSEDMITSLLSNLYDWEKLRSQARGQTKLFLYMLRNTIFDINPSTIRKKIPATYNENLGAYKAILSAANELGVKIIVYIPPLRSDIPAPYDQVEYSDFKAEIEFWARNHQADFINFENLVPGSLWGVKDATSVGETTEYDFMHFQGVGHVMLGQSVAEKIIEALRDF